MQALCYSSYTLMQLYPQPTTLTVESSIFPHLQGAWASSGHGLEPAKLAISTHIIIVFSIILAVPRSVAT